MAEPNAPWLTLYQATEYAATGWACPPGRNAPLSAHSSMPLETNTPRKGFILAHQPQGCRDWDDPAWQAFIAALLQAGFEGDVRFRGVPAGGTTDHPMDIPCDAFASPLRLEAWPGTLNRDHPMRDVFWQDVTVNRDDFEDWFALAYPAAIDGDGGEAVRWRSSIEAGAPPKNAPCTFEHGTAWIAARGSMPPVANINETMERGACELRDRLAVGDIVATGKRTKNGWPEEIPKALWRGAAVVVRFRPELPFIMGERGPYIAAAHGTLELGRAPEGDFRKFEEIMLSGADVLRLWPTAGATAKPPKAQATSAHMAAVRAEAERLGIQDLTFRDVEAFRKSLNLPCGRDSLRALARLQGIMSDKPGPKGPQRPRP